MIDPQDVVEGKEFIDKVLCKGCNKIALRLDIKECSKCKMIICENCYRLGLTDMSDILFDNEKEINDENQD